MDPKEAREGLQKEYTVRYEYLEIPFRNAPTQLSITDAHINVAWVQDEQGKQPTEAPVQLTSTQPSHRVKDQIGLINKLGRQAKVPIPLQELFRDRAIKGEKQPVNRVLLVGQAGTGKSTACRQLGYRWSQGEFKDFEVVYLLPVRNLKAAEYDDLAEEDRLATAIAEQCLGVHRTKEKEFKPLRAHIKRQLESDQTLVILDGLDERQDASKVLLEEAQEGKHKLLMTSRLYGLEEFKKQADLQVDLGGLSKAQVRTYVHRYLPDQKQAGELLQFLYTHPAFGPMVQVPVTLNMLCTLWQDPENRKKLATMSGSTTELYEQLTEYTWDRYDEKYNDTNGQKGNRELQNEDRDALLDTLGKIALAGMKKGAALISADTVNKVLKGVKKDKNVSKDMQGTGLLTDMKGSRLLDEVGAAYAFPHLTFQEYFAGRELARQWCSKNKKVRKKAQKFLLAHKDKADYQRVFTFMAGILYRASAEEEGAEDALESFFKVLEEARTKHGASVMQAPESDSLSVLLPLRCLNECLRREMEAEDLEGFEELSEELLKSLEGWIKRGLKEAEKGYYTLQEQLISALPDLNLILDKRVVPIYNKALASEDLGVRFDAVAALNALARGPLREALVEALKKGQEKDKQGNDGTTALMWAAGSGHTEAVKALLKAGAGMDITEKDDWTALMGAAQEGHTAAVKALLEAGAGIDKPNNKGETALMLAAERGHTEAVKALLEAGADKDKQDNKDWTALMIAAERGHTEAVKALLEAGADKDMKTKKGFTALMWAAQEGHTEAVRALLKEGAEMDLQTKKGSTALMLAVHKGHTEAVRALVEKGAGMDIKNNDGFTALMLAAQNGHTEAVKALIGGGADMNIQKENGSTALMLAAGIGHTEAVRALVEKGADMDVKANNGATALMLAAGKGHTEAVKALLEGGADKDMQTKDGYTALIYAAQEGHTEAVRALVEKGAGKDMQGEDGSTALMLAAINGHTEAVRALLEGGAEKDKQENQGFTALMLAAAKGHTEAVRALLQKGADMDIQTKSGHTVLMIAAQEGHTAAVKALLQKGADKDIKSNNGYTALMKAAKKGHTESVKALLKEGADKDKQDNKDWTALMFAAEKGHTAAVKALLKEGEGKDMQTKSGATALMKAAQEGHTAAVKALLEAGADKDLQTKKGHTALMIAAHYGHSEIVSLLEKD